MVNGVKNYHQAITWQLMSIYEPLFKDSSYGYCLNRVQNISALQTIVQSDRSHLPLIKYFRSATGNDSCTASYPSLTLGFFRIYEVWQTGNFYLLVENGFFF